MIGRFVTLASVCGVLGAIQWGTVQSRPDVAGLMLLAGIGLMYARVRVIPEKDRAD